MIRVAFTLIGGKNWTGGYNYLLNLVRALREHAADRIQPVLFFGTDIDENEAEPFRQITGTDVIHSDVFNASRKQKRLLIALITGNDPAAGRVFQLHGIDVVFENAQFYGWRFPIPAVAWIPDFQHRHLSHLFDFKAYWQREVGFRAQILGGRRIMLSSEDARRDCEKFYPSARNRTSVVHFALPACATVDMPSARAVADGYELPETFFFLPNQFWAHKNHVCVIEALRLLKARGKNCVVAASGKQADARDPLHFPRVRDLIKSAGLEKNFRLLGLIPHEHIPALMRCGAALINPSRFEGWSTTVEEAKAMGTPMILSDLKVHREQSDTAIFFDPSSPTELASILERYQPTPCDERQRMTAHSATRATVAMKFFADEFGALISTCAVPR